MAATIDERVVEMRFDNKQFEEGVKKSMKSLNKLDETINKMDESTNLDEMTKKINKINFDGMEDSLKKLGKRFSAFGIAGMTVVQDLTHATEKLFGTFTKFLSRPLAIAKSGGWARALNIEEAKFQLKGLGVAWEEVSDDIDYAVSGTAFGLDAAAKAASQLTASGVELGDSMKQALRGISGVAAMTNSAYEEISPIFTTVAGQGKLMTMQLRQLEARGLNAAAQLAKAIGVTEAELRDMVTKGVIDFNTFAKAMDDAFGEHAKDANSTFSGALGNMQFALKKIGAKLAEEIQTDFIDVFNDARGAINVLGGALQPAIDTMNQWVKIASLGLRVLIQWAVESDTLHNTVYSLSYRFKQLSNIVAVILNEAIGLVGPLVTAFVDLGTATGNLLKTVLGIKNNIGPLETIFGVLRLIANALAISLTTIANTLSSIFNYLAGNKEFRQFFEMVSPFIIKILPLAAGLLLLSKLRILGIVAAITAISGAIAAIIHFNIPAKLMSVANVVAITAKTIWTQLKPGLDAIKEKAAGVVGVIGGAISSLWEFIRGLGQGEKQVEKTVKTTTTATVDILGALSKIWESFKTWFVNFANGLDLAELSILGMGAAFAFAAVMIGKSISRISKNIQKLNPLGFLDSLTFGVRTLLTEMGKMMSAYGKAQKLYAISSVIRAIALAFAVLTAAVLAFHYAITKDLGAFIGSVVVVSILAGLAIGLTIAIKNLVKAMTELNSAGVETEGFLGPLSAGFKEFGKALKQSAIAIMITMLAAALMGLAIALSLLSAQPLENLMWAAGSIAVLMVSLSVIIGVMSKMASGKNGTTVTTAILGIAAMIAAFASALYLVAIALDQLNKLEINLHTILNLVTVFAVMVTGVGILIGFAAIFKDKLETLTKTILNIGLGLLAFSVAAFLLPDVIDHIGECIHRIAEGFKNMSDEAARALADMLTTSPLVLAIGIGIVTLASHFAEHMVSAVGIMTGFINAFNGFVEIIAKLASNDDAKWLERFKDIAMTLVVVIGFVGAIISAVLVASHFAGNAGKAAAMLISIPFALLGTILAFKIAFQMGQEIFDPAKVEALDRGLKGVVALIGTLAAVIIVASIRPIQSGAKALMGLSVVIAATTFCLALLGILAKRNPEGMIAGATSMFIAFLGIAQVIAKLGKEIKWGEIVKVSVLITTLVVVISSVVGTLAYLMTLGGVNWDTLMATAAGLSMTLLAVAGALRLIMDAKKLVDWKQVGQMIVLMTAIILDLFPIALALYALLEMTKGYAWSDLIAAATSLGLVILAVAGAFRIAADAGDVDFEKAIAVASGILLTTLALYPIIGALALLSAANINYGDIAAGVLSLSTMLIVVSTAFRIASNVEELDWKKAIAIALGITATSIAFYPIIGALKLLSVANIDYTDIAAGVLALSTMLIAVSTAFRIATTDADLDWKKAIAIATGVTLTALAFYPIVGALKLLQLGDVDFGKMMAGIIPMSALIIALAAAFRIVSSIDVDFKKALSIASGMALTALAFIPIALALSLIPAMNLENAISVTAAMGLLFLELALVFKVLSTMVYDPAAVASSIAGMLLTSAAFPIIAAGLAIVAKYDVANIIAAAVALGVLFLEVGVIFGILSVISTNVSGALMAMLGIVAVSASFPIIAAAVAIVAGYDVPNIIAAAVGLGVLFLELGVVFGILSILATNIPGAIAATLGIVAVSASFPIIAAALSMIAQYDLLSLLGATAALGALFLELGMALAALSVLGTNVAGMLAASAAMVIISVTLPIMAAGLVSLAEAMRQCTPEQILAMTIQLVALVGVFGLVVGGIGVIGGLVPTVIPSILAVGVAFLAMGFAMDLAGNGVQKMSAGFTLMLNTLSITLPKISSGVTKLGNAVKEFINNVSSAFTNLVSKQLPKQAKGLIKTIKIIGTGIIEILTAIGEGILNSIDTLLSTLIANVTKGISNIITSVTLLSIYFIRSVGLIFTTLAQTAYEGVITIARAIRYGIEDAKYILTGDINDIANWIPRSIGAGMADHTEELIQTSYNMGAEIIEAIRDATGIHSESEELKEIGTWIPDSLNNGIQFSIGNPIDTVRTLGETVITTLSGVIEGGSDKVGGSILDAVSDGASAIGIDISNIGGSLGDMFAGAFGTEAVNGVKNVLSSLTGLDVGGLFNFGKKGLSNAEVMAQARADILNNSERLKAIKAQAAKEEGWVEGRSSSIEYTKTFSNAIAVAAKTIRETSSAAGGLDALQEKLEGLLHSADDLTGGLDNTTGATDDLSGGMANLGDTTGGAGAAAQQASSYWDQLTDSMQGAFDVTQGFDKTLNMTAEDLLKNAQDIATAIDEWDVAIQVLNARGFDRRFIQQLIDMGPVAGRSSAEAALSMTKTQKKTFNTLYKNGKDWTAQTTEDFKQIVGDDGAYLGREFSKEFVKNSVEGISGIWDDFHLTGEQEEQAVEKTAEEIAEDLHKTLTKKVKYADYKKYGGKMFTNLYKGIRDGSSMTKKESKLSLKGYIANMYLASLSEQELAEAMELSTEELTQRMMEYWKESTESMQSDIQDQMRAMNDLKDAYKQTGDDLIAQWKKQNSEYEEMNSNKYFLASIFDTMDKPQNLFSDYIRNAASNEEIISLIDGYTKAFASGGKEAAEAWLLEASRAWKGNGAQKSMTTLIQEYEYALETGNNDLIKSIGEQLQGSITHIKSYAEIYNDVVDGIEAGIKKLLSSNKDISRMSKTITRVYSGMSSALGVEAFRTGEEAIRKYAMSLIDWEEVLEESKVFGVDSESIIETRINDITDSLLSFRNSVESNLKGALQSFDKFDVGEKISFETLQKNLRSNMTTMNEWRANIRKLQAKGYSEEVIRAMEEEGVSSYQKVAALVDSEVTDAQVDSINQMWQQTGLAARDAADEATGAMIMAASTAGQDLTDSMNIVIEESAEEAKTMAYDLYTGVGESAIDGLDASNLPENVEEIMNETVDAIVNTVTDPANLKEITNAGIKAGEKLTHGIRKGIQDTIPETKEKAKRLAAHAIDGVRKGLEEGKGPLYEKVRLIARRCLEEAEDELDINSPSKKTEWIARMAMKGFEVGIDNEANNVTNDMISWVDDFMRYADEAANEIQAYWDNVGADTEIKPVLNLDNLQNARSLIGDMLKGDQTIALTSGKLAAEASVNDNAMMRLIASLNHTGNTTNTNNYGDTTIVVNAPEGADTNEIAEMVMIKIQQRIDRRKYV